MKKTTKLDQIFQKVRRDLIDSKRRQLAETKRLEGEKHQQVKLEENAIKREIELRLEDITQNILGLIASSPTFAKYLWSLLIKDDAYNDSLGMSYTDSLGIFTKKGAESRIVKLRRLWHQFQDDDRRRGIALFISVSSTKELFGEPIMKDLRIVLARFWQDAVRDDNYSVIDSYRSHDLKNLTGVLEILNGSDPHAIFKYFFERFGEYHNL